MLRSDYHKTTRVYRTSFIPQLFSRFRLSRKKYKQALYDSKYTPLTLRMYFKAPILLTHPWINFDGLLAHLVIRLVLSEDYYFLNSSDPYGKRVRHLPIPISNSPFPLASITYFYDHQGRLIDPIDSVRITTIYKRFHEPEAHIIQTTKKKIDINRGKLKNYAIRIPYLAAAYAEVHLIAKLPALLLLLNFLHGLGKKVAYGYGQISRFAIIDNPIGKSVWDPKTETALRPIPTFYCKEYESFAYLAWRPAYWNKRNVAPCVPVGETCVLKDEYYQKIFAYVK